MISLIFWAFGLEISQNWLNDETQPELLANSGKFDRLKKGKGEGGEEE